MNATVSGYNRLPAQLQQFNQWCVAGPDKAPYVADKAGLRRVSLHDHNALHTFQDACAIGAYYKAPIGYILAASDPFTCIDLDVKDSLSKDKTGAPYDASKWTTQAELDRYKLIINHFNSYSELSNSGKGVHIWVLGNIGEGHRRDGVECYSQERFIICTGNSISDVQYSINAQHQAVVLARDGVLPVAEGGPSLAAMVVQMKASVSHKVVLHEVEDAVSDSEIVERASNAENGHKFQMLCNGQWQQLQYPSQSEADLSLMSMLTFYSESNEQCRRIFRMTALGKREKAVKDNRYLDKTLELIRGRQSHDTAVKSATDDVVSRLVAEMQAKLLRQQAAAPLAVKELNLPKPEYPDELTWPPGMAGALAGYMYQSSYRPVREVSIVATLGLLAGICGKVWCLDDTGLNLYITLVARSGVGKEGMHSGISKVLNTISSVIPMASKFVTFSDFASGPALQKYCAVNSSFVSVTGEWGRKLKRMSIEDGREGPMQQLRTVMTNLYSKSGPTSIAGGISYSDKGDNVDSVSGVNYSMIGETTPGTFYESLTPSMMEDGFMSRFLLVEYSGDRPPANDDKAVEPSRHLVDAMCGLCTHAGTLLARYENQKISYTPAAKQLSRDFDKECDAMVNSYNDESFRQMWNRAHLKSLRVAGLLAVADNWVNPTIDKHHLEWGIQLIRRDIALVSKHLLEGDVGIDDSSRERKLLQIIRNYPLAELAPSYKIPTIMQKDLVIPRRFLQTKTQHIAAFAKHKGGANQALDFAIKSLIENGYLAEVERVKVLTTYAKGERCFKILDL